MNNHWFDTTWGRTHYRRDPQDIHTTMQLHRRCGLGTEERQREVMDEK